MKVSTRIALFNFLGLLGLWIAITTATGAWDTQRSSIWSSAMVVAAAVVVLWRVERAYSVGAVGFSRAVTEGFVSGAAFAVAVQLLYWGYMQVAGYTSLGAITNTEGLVNLLQQASYAGALGAVLAVVLWAINGIALRRAVL